MKGLQPADLTERDRLVLLDLARVRLLTGGQLERLHFAGLVTPNARSSARRRSLGRLQRLGLVATLPRRVGGVRAGSAGLIYTLDARAHRERPLWDEAWQPSPDGRVRRPWSLGWLFVAHTLGVAELYVQSREAERAGQLRLRRFDAEPAAWFTDGQLTVKPDAYLVVEAGGWERHWWLEVDRATESLPTIRRKLGRYLGLYEHGSTGPVGVLPTVLVTTPDERRAEQIAGVIRELTAPSGYLHVVTFDRASDLIPGAPPRPPP